MVATTDTTPNKTAFIRNYLQKNPKGTLKAVNEAWTKAGHAGNVSETLVSQQRRDLGLSGNLRDRSKSMESNGAAVKPQTSPKSVEQKATTPKAEGKMNGGARKANPTPKSVEPMTTAPKAVVPKPPAPKAQGKSQATSKPASAASSENKVRVLVEMEREIDELIYKVRDLGGLPEVQEALRAARRLLVRSHEA